MKVRGSYRPNDHEYEVLPNGTAVIRLYENIEEYLKEGENGQPDSTGWEFDRYTITRPHSEHLHERITNETAAWLEFAKEEETKEVRQKEINGLKAQLQQIDHDAGAGRAFRAVAMDFGNLVRRLHDTNPDLAEFDPDGNEDLTRIINLETEAIAIREQLSPLLTS